jgi:hypothetical protein
LELKKLLLVLQTLALALKVLTLLGDQRVQRCPIDRQRAPRF